MFKDLSHLTGVCGHGIYGTGILVYPVKPLLHLFIWGDNRFGDDWPARHRTRLTEKRGDKWKTCSGEAGGPGRIPAQMIAHILYYFSLQGHLVFDSTRLPSPTDC